MTSIENIADQGQSIMELACEQAQLFGTAPEADEFDSRDVWDENDALDAVHAAFEILADGIGPDGTQLADERESLLWGFVNMLDAFVSCYAQSCDGIDTRNTFPIFSVIYAKHSHPYLLSCFFPRVEYRVELIFGYATMPAWNLSNSPPPNAPPSSRPPSPSAPLRPSSRTRSPGSPGTTA